MYVETAAWIRDRLAAIDLPSGGRVADLGSSTLHYRTVDQPHVDGEVLAPLRDRGLTISHVDIKEDEGVDVVFDVGDAKADPLTAIGSDFDLVLSVGMLQVVPDWRRGVEVLAALTAPGGWLLAESPHVFRRVFDPEDNFWRPSPDDLVAAFREVGDFDVVAAESIRIDTERQYRGLVSRPSWTPFAERIWLPVPGFTERIRYRVPRWRWRDSVVLLRRSS